MKIETAKAAIKAQFQAQTKEQLKDAARILVKDTSPEAILASSILDKVLHEKLTEAEAVEFYKELDELILAQ